METECVYTGIVTDAPTHHSHNVYSYDACREACNKNLACIAFTYFHRRLDNTKECIESQWTGECKYHYSNCILKSALFKKEKECKVQGLRIFSQKCELSKYCSTDQGKRK